VQLVDDDKAQIAEEFRDRRMTMQEQRLERLRRDLQDAGRTLHQPRLMRLPHIPMPVPDRDIRPVTQLRQALKLIVDQCFQRADVDTTNRSRRILVKERDDRKERRLRLAGRRGGCEQDVIVRPEDRLRRRKLDAAQTLPLLRIDIVAHKGRIAVKYAHSSNSANSALISAPSTSFCAYENSSEPSSSASFNVGF